MEEFKWNGKTYTVSYIWDTQAQNKLWLHLNQQEKKNTREVIDNELMAMDLLEMLVDDSENQDAVNMLTTIGIRC
jgi:hypothetical protein